MKRSLLAVACLLLGCSGTESGNPTRGGMSCDGVRCAECAPPITLQVTDSTSGGPVGAAITVDGQPVACQTSSSDPASECALTDSNYAVAGKREIVVAAAGYGSKTITVDVPAKGGAMCCPCIPGSVSAALTLDPLR
jgi:hypothetical protein